MKQALRFLLLALFAAAAVAEDEPPGLSALRAQAEAGSADAQVEMGILYEYGFRMPDNLVPALAWYMRAADSGSTAAAQKRDALAARLTAAQVDEAKRLAAEIAAKRPESSLAPAPAPAPETAPMLQPDAATAPASEAAPAAQMEAETPADPAAAPASEPASIPSEAPAPAETGAAPPAENAPAPTPDTKKLF